MSSDDEQTTAKTKMTTATHHQKKQNPQMASEVLDSADVFIWQTTVEANAAALRDLLELQSAHAEVSPQAIQEYFAAMFNAVEMIGQSTLGAVPREHWPHGQATFAELLLSRQILRDAKKTDAALANALDSIHRLLSSSAPAAAKDEDEEEEEKTAEDADDSLVETAMPESAMAESTMVEESATSLEPSVALNSAQYEEEQRQKQNQERDLEQQREEEQRREAEQKREAERNGDLEAQRDLQQKTQPQPQTQAQPQAPPQRESLQSQPAEKATELQRESGQQKCAPTDPPSEVADRRPATAASSAPPKDAEYSNGDCGDKRAATNATAAEAAATLQEADSRVKLWAQEWIARLQEQDLATRTETMRAVQQAIQEQQLLHLHQQQQLAMQRQQVLQQQGRAQVQSQAQAQALGLGQGQAQSRGQGQGLSQGLSQAHGLGPAQGPGHGLGPGQAAALHAAQLQALQQQQACYSAVRSQPELFANSSELQSSELQQQILNVTSVKSLSSRDGRAPPSFPQRVRFAEPIHCRFPGGQTADNAAAAAAGFPPSHEQQRFAAAASICPPAQPFVPFSQAENLSDSRYSFAGHHQVWRPPPPPQNRVLPLPEKPRVPAPVVLSRRNPEQQTPAARAWLPSALRKRMGFC